MARPRIRAVGLSVKRSSSCIWLLTVDVALALVCLCNEQIRHMPANAILIRDRVSTKHLLKPKSGVRLWFGGIEGKTYVRELISARSQFCLLIMEIISGAALPSSLSLPT